MTKKSKEEIEKIFQRIKSDDPTLKTADLYFTQTRGEKLSEFLEALKNNTSLTEIDLGWNILSDEDISHLTTTIIQQNKSIIILNLRDNTISIIGSEAISSLLANNNSLENLSLRDSKIGAEGMKALEPGLMANNSLSILDLSRSELGDAGAISLASALTINYSLTKIDLHCNDITNEGALELANTLTTNASLTALNLDDNDEISQETLNDIGQKLDRNQQLQPTVNKLRLLLSPTILSSLLPEAITGDPKKIIMEYYGTGEAISKIVEKINSDKGNLEDVIKTIFPQIDLEKILQQATAPTISNNPKKRPRSPESSEEKDSEYEEDSSQNQTPSSSPSHTSAEPVKIHYQGMMTD